jgi:hypothetical protein
VVTAIAVSEAKHFAAEDLNVIVGSPRSAVAAAT